MSPSSELAARLEAEADKYSQSAVLRRESEAHFAYHLQSDMVAVFSRMATYAEQHAADLRAAAQAVRAMEWRPIAGAPDDKPLLTGRWVEREWMEPVGTFSKLAAQRLGYTHYFIVPGPPEVGG